MGDLLTQPADAGLVPSPSSPSPSPKHNSPASARLRRGSNVATRDGPSQTHMIPHRGGILPPLFCLIPDAMVAGHGTASSCSGGVDIRGCGAIAVLSVPPNSIKKLYFVVTGSFSPFSPPINVSCCIVVALITLNHVPSQWGVAAGVPAAPLPCIEDPPKTLRPPYRHHTQLGGEKDPSVLRFLLNADATSPRDFTTGQTLLITTHHSLTTPGRDDRDGTRGGPYVAGPLSGLQPADGYRNLAGVCQKSTGSREQGG